MVRNRVAFLFPGQGAQRPGMGRDFHESSPTAREVFAIGSRVLEFDLAEACFNGSEEQLRQTSFAQPALLAVSLAAQTVVAQRGLQASYVAGHSLGEFAAWVASGALALPEAFHLIGRRARLMEAAARRTQGGMVAVLGLSEVQVCELCRQAEGRGVAVPANFNAPGEIVVSGQPEALAAVRELVKTAGGRAIPLRVSGAFHSPLMAGAAEDFAQDVRAAGLHAARIPVVCNLTGEPVTEVAEIRTAMAGQMASPVRWEASIKRMLAEGVDAFVELGAGEVLTKLAKRIAPEAAAYSVSDMGGMESLTDMV